MYQREIDLFDLAAGKLTGELTMCRVVARDQEHATSKPVQAVNNAGPQGIAHAGKCPIPMQQRIHQRAGVAAGAGMHDHPSRFVDGDNVVVFV